MSRRTLLLLRWSVFLLAVAFLYARLVRHGGPEAFGDIFGTLDPQVVGTTLLMVLVLMVVNWGLESMKWRLLMRGVEPVSRLRAFAATMAGTSIGLITPNRVGEFVGRVLFLAPDNRISGAFATVVGSIAQFVVTVLFGAVGLIALRPGTWDHDADPWQAIAGLVLCAMVLLGGLLLYFDPDLLRTLTARLPWVRRWERHAAVLERFRSRELLAVLLLSMARYVVFTAQFAIILAVVAEVRPDEALPAIPVAFLISTLVPTVMITELGVRGSVAVALISPHLAHDRGVFLATTLLWTINIALPALAGSIILLAARIRSARQ